MKNPNKKSISLGTVITVALAGAVLGAMFIPYRKNKIRKTLVEGIQDFTAYASDFIKEKSEEFFKEKAAFIDQKLSGLNKHVEETNEIIDQLVVKNSTQKFNH